MTDDSLQTWSFQELIDGGLLEIGDGYRAKNRELGGDGPIFLRAGHVTDTHIDFTAVERFWVGCEDALRAKMAQPGDTIITTKGNSTGRTSFVTEQMPPFVYSPHLSYWRSCDPSQVANGFLRYWSRGPEFRRQLSAMKTSTDMAPYLSLTDQRRLAVTLPPVRVQQAIGHILGALDDNIELNRRMNQTLEAMARAIFKSWFVDFDPVRAKAEGQKAQGLSRDVANLFPDSFEDSELGEIPKGWRCVSLPDLAEVNPMRSLRKGQVAPYLDMANMPTKGHFPTNWIERPFGSGMRFINGDTLVARITPCLENGKTAMATFLADGEVAWGSTEFIVLRPKPPLPPAFAYLLARTDEFRQFAIQRMSGSSGRQRVPAENLAQYRLVRPSDDVASTFGRVVEPLFHRADVNAHEVRTLAALRDALLPKLISGELRVPDAERIVGRAL